MLLPCIVTDFRARDLGLHLDLCGASVSSSRIEPDKYVHICTLLVQMTRFAPWWCEMEAISTTSKR